MRVESPADPVSVEQRRQRLQRDQRRRMWLNVLLPFIFVLAVCIAILGVSLSLRSPAQVALVADSLLTALVLIPMVLCLFPVVILCLALVAMASRWHARSRSPLGRLEMWTAALAHNVDGWLGQVDGRVLNWAVRLAPVRQLLAIFEEPAEERLEESEEAKEGKEG